jgi:hypothetical protein
MSDCATRPTYFWSGSNRAGEVLALARHGQPIGVAVDTLDEGGAGLRALLSLAARRTRFVAGVTRARGGAPIVMFDRRRAAYRGLPQGDVAGFVAGRRVTVAFRKIAVNVARGVAGGANELGSLLRRLFGPDAGARGEGHRVAIEFTPRGWELSVAEADALDRSEVPVFVDSGAFSEVRFDARAGRMVDCAPISHEEWVRRLDVYRQLAERLGSRVLLVAPDKVGDQGETLRRLARYAPQLRRLRDMGAQIIVPIQRGAVAPAAFDARCAEILGFGDFVRGIPSKKAAATVEQIAELSAALPADARVHLLGLGPFGPRYRRVMAALSRPAELVSCDSNRIRALVGASNGPGGGPRVLTRLTWNVKRALGIAGAAEGSVAELVKFWTLDAYFSNHFAGVPA